MARPLRIECEGALYHVTSRGNERKKVFFTKRDYNKFKEYVIEAQKKFGFILHCYVLMPNHYHILIETPDKNLSRIMHYVNSSYTMYINTKRKRCGHLFQGRYKAIIVDKDSYLIELSKYIHLNPVRAKIVEKPEGYAYSSYKAYITDQPDPIASNSYILLAFSQDVPRARIAYKVFVEDALGKDFESPLKDVFGGGILGGEDFVSGIIENIEEEKLNNQNIANRNALRISHNIDTILAQVSDHFDMPVKGYLKKGSSLRKKTVYILKRFSDASNKQISDLLGLKSDSAAAKIYLRFMKELERDDELKLQVEALEASMSLVKARPQG